jgi:hypothetical protein
MDMRIHQRSPKLGLSEIWLQDKDFSIFSSLSGQKYKKANFCVKENQVRSRLVVNPPTSLMKKRKEKRTIAIERNSM